LNDLGIRIIHNRETKLGLGWKVELP
jgi:hypothetical protein